MNWGDLWHGYTDTQKLGLTFGAGSLGAGLGSMFGGNGPNPYDKAAQFYNQIPGKVQPFYQPYMQAGQNALGQLQGQYGSLVNDPNATLNKIGAGYQKSPGYDWQLNQGMNAASNAAAAGGLAGSPQHQQQAATMAEGLANQDYYNYLNKALGLYGTGLQGLGGLNTMGFNANEGMAGVIGNALAQQGGLAYQGQLAQNQQQGNQWGDIFGGLASIAPYFLGI